MVMEKLKNDYINVFHLHRIINSHKNEYTNDRRRCECSGN
jgi:hypothetical protein